MTLPAVPQCWICGSRRLALAKASDLERSLDSNAFAITDSHYGRTAEIQRCGECDFLQCTDLAEVLAYYEGLEDREYEDGRTERALQMNRLLRRIAASKPGGGGRLLDVGAGSGILVEEAAKFGYQAEGVEPSEWLQARAADRGLRVVRGTLPHPELRGPYDVVSMIDVIEHVSNPIALLEQARALLAPDGLLAVVTPDVGSWTARLLGWKWWHFRVAHIGYFQRSNLELALQKSGIEIGEVRRPTWYFSASYLTERVNAYLPGRLRLPTPRFLDRITVPLNLGDSFLVIGRPTSQDA